MEATLSLSILHLRPALPILASVRTQPERKPFPEESVALGELLRRGGLSRVRVERARKARQRLDAPSSARTYRFLSPKVTGAVTRCHSSARGGPCCHKPPMEPSKGVQHWPAKFIRKSRTCHCRLARLMSLSADSRASQPCHSNAGVKV